MAQAIVRFQTGLFAHMGVEATPVVTREGEDLWEIKNLAVRPDLRRQGIGRKLVDAVCRRCPGGALRVGTGETPGTLQFYRACGFVFSHRVPDFFTRNYDHPIVEEGVLLRDMIYLQKQLPCGAKQERRSRGYGK